MTETATEGLRAWAEIDHAALRHNADLLAARLPPSTGVMAVVKADAYGHGAAALARTLEPRVAMFAVASLAEAMALQTHTARPIYLLGTALPCERAAIVERGFIATISGAQEAAAYAALASPSRPARLHLAVDTGMGRAGVWQDEAVQAARALASLPGARIEGIATHLPSADEDDAFTAAQLERFARLVPPLRQLLPEARCVHALNSAGTFRHPQHAADLVRVGLALYGLSPLPEHQRSLRPVMQVKTRVLLVRDLGPGRSVSYGRTFITDRPTRVATLGIGYADGYPRLLSGRGAEILLRGQRCPVLGRVTMDQIMVDVGGFAHPVEPGEEAILFGRQGNDEITASELAAKALTIPYEILTGIQGRVRRVHRNTDCA